jgi:hypothetical protein
MAVQNHTSPTREPSLWTQAQAVQGLREQRQGAARQPPSEGGAQQPSVGPFRRDERAREHVEIQQRKPSVH